MMNMLSDIPTLIGQKDSDDLDAPISKDEIKKATWSLHPDKAPRPDDFSIRFYRKWWHIIKKDLICLSKVIFELYSSTKIIKPQEN